MNLLNIISRDTIKPSSPTPPHLRTYKLSVLDQFASHLYLPIVLFYPNDGGNGNILSNSADKCRQLKTSLSKTLTRYYPFAGRLTDSFTIDCNDDGVEYVEARINCQLSEILKQSKGENIDTLFPTHFIWKESYKLGKDSLIGVQVTFFQCGGMAISTCISHKLGDGTTMSSFIGDWAAMASRGKEAWPKFIATSIIPPGNTQFVAPELKFEQRNCITTTYAFEASKLAELKAMAANAGLQNPTRVEVVTALLYKCAMAASNANMGCFKQSILIQLVDMRSRVVPPLPQKSVGNFSWFFAISPGERDMEMEELVGQLRDGIKYQACGGNMEVKDWVKAAIESTKEAKMLLDSDVYRFSIVRGTSLFQVDFGWGKPISVRLANGVVKNTFVLIDTRDGDGIEAMVTLEEGDMAIFQRDEHLLAFATSNQSASPLVVNSKL